MEQYAAEKDAEFLNELSVISAPDMNFQDFERMYNAYFSFLTDCCDSQEIIPYSEWNITLLDVLDQIKEEYFEGRENPREEIPINFKHEELEFNFSFSRDTIKENFFVLEKMITGLENLEDRFTEKWDKFSRIITLEHLYSPFGRKFASQGYLIVGKEECPSENNALFRFKVKKDEFDQSDKILFSLDSLIQLKNLEDELTNLIDENKLYTFVSLKNIKVIPFCPTVLPIFFEKYLYERQAHNEYQRASKS